MTSATPTLIEDSQCYQCKAVKQKSLARCASCRSVRYCSKACLEHQTADWSSHKALCLPVKKSSAKMAQEETALRNHPGDWMTSPNPFETGVGHFWGILATRPYMQQKGMLIDSVRKIRTREAIGTALAETMDVLRLCRGDNLGVRGGAPALMIRLGQDQEAYAFIKWYATSDLDGNYDWGDMDLPFLNLKGEDVIESLDAVHISRKYGISLSHLVALTLVKLRMYLDLKAIADLRSSAAPLPIEIEDRIRSKMISNAAANSAILSKIVHGSEDFHPHLLQAENQLKTLWEKVEEANKHFWPAFKRASRVMAQQPMSYSQGSMEEVQIVFHGNYHSWEETPGAIDWVLEGLRRDEEYARKTPGKSKA